MAKCFRTRPKSVEPPPARFVFLVIPSIFYPEVLMLFELTLVPICKEEHTSGAIAQAIKILELSGLPFQLTPSATLIEGDWEEVIPVIQRCHRELRRSCPHVVTFIKVEDM